MPESRAHYHPAGTSRDSNKCDSIQSFCLRFYNGHPWIRMTRIFIDFPMWSPGGNVDNNTNSTGKSDYQSHLYLKWKSSNIVHHLSMKIYLCSIIINTQFLFLVLLKRYYFLIDHLIMEPSQKLLIMSHLSEFFDVPAGWLCLLQKLWTETSELTFGRTLRLSFGIILLIELTWHQKSSAPRLWFIPTRGICIFFVYQDIYPVGKASYMCVVWCISWCKYLVRRQFNWKASLLNWFRLI